MTVKYKLIALDLDGTLNNDEKKITPKTKEALIKVQQQGVIVALASGRPAPGLSRECKALDLQNYHGLLLSYNGGKVIDATTGMVLYEKSIPNELAVKYLKNLEKFPITPIVDNGQFYYTKDKDGYNVEFECQLNNMPMKMVDNQADAVDFNPVKVLAAAPNQILKQYYDDITRDFVNEFEFIYSAPFYLEANMRGVSKADSLQMVCDILDIAPSQVMAFGDAQNDLSMVKFAGLGVAMENACDELKAIANEITLSNNNDGIAHILNQHFDI